MPLPIICTYERLQQNLVCYRDVFSKPQYKYFVIVLLGFIHAIDGAMKVRPRRRLRRRA
jgi:hypothetical protein